MESIMESVIVIEVGSVGEWVADRPAFTAESNDSAAVGSSVGHEGELGTAGQLFSWRILLIE
jgi:hypothetical protein